MAWCHRSHSPQNDPSAVRPVLFHASAAGIQQLAYLRGSAPQKLVLIGQPANQKSTGSPAYFCEADLEEDWLRSGCTVGMLLVSGAPIECHDLQFHDVPKPDFLKGESLSVHFCVVSSEGFPAKIPRGSALIITSAGC